MQKTSLLWVKDIHIVAVGKEDKMIKSAPYRPVYRDVVTNMYQYPSCPPRRQIKYISINKSYKDFTIIMVGSIAFHLLKEANLTLSH